MLRRCIILNRLPNDVSANESRPRSRFGRWRGVQSWVDGRWGYDVFIAHRRTDGQPYAEALYSRLDGQGVSCFLDVHVYVPGDSLHVATKRHASKATLLVVVGSPSILDHRETDWVEAEIDAYLSAHGETAKVVAVDFGGILGEGAPGAGLDCQCGHLPGASPPSRGVGLDGDVGFSHGWVT